MVFLKLVRLEYQVNDKTQLFWVKVVHLVLVPNIQTLAGHDVGTIHLAPSLTINHPPFQHSAKNQVFIPALDFLVFAKIRLEITNI